MKNLKLIISLILLLNVTITTFPQDLSATTNRGQENNIVYHNPSPGEISIVASTPFPDGCEPTITGIKYLIECGFNVGMSSETIENAKKIFSLIDTLPFKLMVENSGLFNENKYKRVIDELSRETQFGGWKFIDEPRFEKLHQIKEAYDRLLNYDSSYLVYINLIGGLMKPFTGEESNYGSYLNLIEELFYPSLWSYDLYPLSIKNNQLHISYDSFYNNFEIFSRISNQTKRPFWAYCQSMGFKNSVIERPIAKIEYLRFEAFSALAYGAQGIVYWTYGQRYSKQNETYIGALVNLDGEKTPAWYAAKTVNQEIKKYNEIFYQCEPLEVRHTGKNLYEGTKRLEGSFGPFEYIKSGNSGVLVSHLRNKGKDYYVFVSHDVENSQNITFKIRMGSLKLVSSNESSIFTPDRVYKLNLEKGGYYIFESIR